MLNLIPSAILILGLAIFLIMDFSLADRATAAQLIKQGGIWHPEVRPKAIYDAGNTYCTWVDPDGHVGVSRIIHNSGEVRHRKVGQTQVNDHTVPSILIRQPDRRLVLFWTKHNGDSVYRRTSDTPHGIKSFGEVKTFSAPRSTYTQNVQLEGEGNRIYVFYRSRNRWLYRTSDDGAESFSEPTVMLPDYSDKRPRIQVVSDGTNRIHI
ncbi:MAG: BNR-4 repeat-containing protein, partial [Planctomycetota bacterium]